jgi:hypothetical protein
MTLINQMIFYANSLKYAESSKAGHEFGKNNLKLDVATNFLTFNVLTKSDENKKETNIYF